MKPRIRTIKPEAHTDEDLWDLEVETALPIFRAFSGLWCHADREGRFEWRPRPLKAGILPYWEGDFSRVLDALATRGFIVKYTSGGREYGFIPSFGRHQFINNREEQSVLPSPVESESIRIDERVDDERATRDGRVDDASCDVPIRSVPFPSSSVPEGVQGEGAPKPPASSRSMRNLDEALRVPIVERARRVVDSPARRLEDWCSPHQWPEVVELAGAFALALGLSPPRLAAYGRDSGVRAIVVLLATFSGEELTLAVSRAGADDWLRGKGLAALTVEVVRRLLDPQRSKVRSADGGKRQPDYEGEVTYSAAALFARDQQEAVQ